MDGVSLSALQRFARKAQRFARVKGELAILVTSRRNVQELNRRFRPKDKPTEMPSFPPGNGGEIASCAESARQNARKLGEARTDEIKGIMRQGMRHRAGYEH